MNMRRIASLTALLAFLVMVLTAFILYIVPQGRIANWADWRLWGLSKEQWGSVHVNTGLLFLISLALHLYYNWKPIMNYLKNKTKQFKLFTKEFNVAFVLVLIFVLGTFFEIPPFSSFLALSDSIKNAAAVKYGEPPYGHAELSSLKSFAKNMGIDPSQGIEQLRKAGFQADHEMQTLAQISRLNNTSPQQVYQALKPVVAVRDSEKVSGSGMGYGRMTLAELCQNFSIPEGQALHKLAGKGIKADLADKLREIAAAHGTSPQDIAEIIRPGG